MPDIAARPHEDHEDHEDHDGAVVADRRCWRCLQMFPGDPSIAPTAFEGWWVCDPCDASLFPGKG